jgi:hypothetical protein
MPDIEQTIGKSAMEVDQYSQMRKARTRIFARAKSRCEWCGVENNTPVQNTNTFVRLSIGYLNHNFDDIRDKNLIALCQNCLEKHDNKYAEKARKTLFALRRRTQRRLPTLVGRECEKCGATEDLQRHHKDYTETNIRIVCKKCHPYFDLLDGTRPKGKVRKCVICGVEFKKPKPSMTCYNKECFRELRRRIAAEKRGVPCQLNE